MTRKEKLMYSIVDDKNKGKKHKTKFANIAKNMQLGTVKLAEMTGLENCQISNYLSGKNTNMMLDTAKKICNSLGTSLDETFGDGQVDLKTNLLKQIESDIKKLDGRDAEGHLWYNKFKNIILNIGQDIQEDEKSKTKQK